MFRVSHRYENDSTLTKFLIEHAVSANQGCFVRVFSSHLTQNEFSNLTALIRKHLPFSSILCASSCEGIVLNGEHIDNATMINLDIYNSLDITIKTFSWENVAPGKLARQVHDSLKSAHNIENSVVHVLFSDKYIEGNEFLDTINSLSPILKLAGGLVGTTQKHKQATLMLDGIPVKKGMVAFTVTGENQSSFISCSTSHDRISEEFTITKSTGIYIDEIENQDALAWMFDYLNITRDNTIPIDEWAQIVNRDYLVYFPILVDGAGNNGLFTRYDPNKNKLALYHSQLKPNTKFNVGYLTPAKTIKQGYKLCEDVLNIPTETVFSYTCYFRKIFLENCSKWEMAPFAKHDICAIFVIGEIAFINDKNYFHNGAFVLTGVAEEQKFIIPDTKLLELSDKVEDDKTFLDKQIEISQITADDSKQALLHQLNKHEMQYDVENEHMDKALMLPNVFRYEEDKIRYSYDKICLMEIQTADATIAFAGQEKYCESMRKTISLVRARVEEITKTDNLPIYTLNYKTFFLASASKINDSQFRKLCRSLYEAFEYISSDTGLTVVARFVVILNQENMLDFGMNMLFAHKDLQENFIVCDRDVLDDTTAVEEIKCIDLLSRSIEFDTIVPYYQGIHNNETGTIDKFEALMRIVDTDGAVYTPFYFLDTAKKYKFYKRISKIMIGKVLDDFCEREETVTVNISLYDVISSSFRRWFYAKLRKYPHPNRVVIEFVETENISTLDVLFEFIEIVRSIGVKIAIDDFGSGYSTFATVVELKPDFIKIDGSIVKNIENSDQSGIILDTICYLSKRMGTQTVAEFVETQGIQDIILQRGITHSQGYLFSQPAPLIK